MPTYEALPRFLRDFERLNGEQQQAFIAAVGKFVVDLNAGKFRKGLRVKAIRGAPGIFEMMWAQDGRATFQYGPERRAGEVHIIWRRCGTHDILTKP